MTNAVGARYSEVLNKMVELNACNTSKVMTKAMQVMWVID